MMTTTTTNKRHFYGFYWSYGIDTYFYDADRRRLYPSGILHVFDSIDARDQWVAEEPYDGGARNHRSKMSAAEAVSIIRDDVRQRSNYPEDVAYYDIDKLISEWNLLYAD